VQEPRDLPRRRLRQHVPEPSGLGGIVGGAEPEDERVEADEAPAGDILDPPILAEAGTPAGEPRAVDRLARVARFTDIVVAGNGAPACRQARKKFGGIGEVLLDLGAVDGHVAGVDDEIGPLGRDPLRERRPVVGEMRFLPAQMRIGDLDDPHGSSARKAARLSIVATKSFAMCIRAHTARKAARSGIAAKTARHPARRSRSAWSGRQWLPPQKPTTGI
jgi:hypothetical protein